MNAGLYNVFLTARPLKGLTDPLLFLHPWTNLWSLSPFNCRRQQLSSRSRAHEGAYREPQGELLGEGKSASGSFHTPDVWVLILCARFISGREGTQKEKKRKKNVTRGIHIPLAWRFTGFSRVGLSSCVHVSSRGKGNC